MKQNICVSHYEKWPPFCKYWSEGKISNYWPPQSLGLWFPKCPNLKHLCMDIYAWWPFYTKKTGDVNFPLSQFYELCVGSVFPFTHPRFRFNIKNIYAWWTSHLCVVLHFLIFVTKFISTGMQVTLFNVRNNPFIFADT